MAQSCATPRAIGPPPAARRTDRRLRGGPAQVTTAPERPALPAAQRAFVTRLTRLVSSGDDPQRNQRNQSVYTALTGLVVFGLAAITGPLLARSLGPAGRGDLAAVLVPSELLGYALAFGLPMATLYHADDYPRRQLVMGVGVFAMVVGGAIVAVAWWLVPTYLHGHPPETVTWLRIMLLVSLVFVPATTVVHLLRNKPSMASFNVFNSMQLVVESIIIITLAIAGHLTLTTALWAALVSHVLWYTAIFTYRRRWLGRGFRWSTLRVQLSYGSRLAIGSLSWLAIARLDQFVLVGAVPSAKLGEYSVAATAAMVSSAAAAGIGFVLFPRIRRAATPEEGWAATRTGARWTFAASCLIGALVGVLAPIAIPLLFGHAFRGAITPLWIMIPGQVAFDVGGAISQKALADNRPAVLSRAMALACGVTIVGLALTVHAFGIIGAAVVTSLSQFVFLAYIWVVVARYHRAEVGRAAAA
jgi:O-antigen/teichoic acid export membrane protein